jgi:hypothetical protein
MNGMFLKNYRGSNSFRDALLVRDQVRRVARVDQSGLRFRKKHSVHQQILSTAQSGGYHHRTQDPEKQSGHKDAGFSLSGDTGIYKDTIQLRTRRQIVPYIQELFAPRNG